MWEERNLACLGRFSQFEVSPSDLTPSRASGFSKLRTSELSEDGAHEL
jgi:hypothetical protein